MDTYTSESRGLTITLEEGTVSDLKALATLTREPEHVLLAAAVEALRAARLRTATARSAAPARARRSAQ